MTSPGSWMGRKWEGVPRPCCGFIHDNLLKFMQCSKQVCMPISLNQLSSNMSCWAIRWETDSSHSRVSDSGSQLCLVIIYPRSSSCCTLSQHSVKCMVRSVNSLAWDNRALERKRTKMLWKHLTLHTEYVLHTSRRIPAVSGCRWISSSYTEIIPSLAKFHFLLKK